MLKKRIKVKNEKEKRRRTSSCPNRGHCSKDESKCCYLLSHTHKCYLDCEESGEFI